MPAPDSLPHPSEDALTLNRPAPSLEVAEAASPQVCPNCGAERLGTYCYGCGQYQLQGRLTLRRLWAEFAARVFNLDRGLLATVVSLTRRPGLVPLDYVEGRRRRYTNPLSYLLLASAFSLFMLQFSEGVLREQIQRQLAGQRADEEVTTTDAPPADAPDDPGATDRTTDGEPADPARERFSARLDELFGEGDSTEFFELMMEGMTRFNAALTVFLCIPLVLLLRLFFGPVRNVAEITVFALYVVGHATLLASLASFGLVRLGQAASMLALLVYVGLVAWAAAQFWGEGLSAAARAAAAMIASYGAYFVVVMVVAMVFIFDTIIDETGYSWGAFLGRLFRAATNE